MIGDRQILRIGNSRLMARLVFLLALLVVAASGVSHVAGVSGEDGSSVARAIKIGTRWGGLRRFQQTEVFIQRKNGKYYRGRKSVDSRLVEDLVSALKQPILGAPDFADLGITPEWIKGNAVRAEIKARGHFADGAQNQQDLYVRSMNDDVLMRNVVADMFQFVRT